MGNPRFPKETPRKKSGLEGKKRGGTVAEEQARHASFPQRADNDLVSGGSANVIAGGTANLAGGCVGRGETIEPPKDTMEKTSVLCRSAVEGDLDLANFKFWKNPVVEDGSSSYSSEDDIGSPVDIGLKNKTERDKEKSSDSRLICRLETDRQDSDDRKESIEPTEGDEVVKPNAIALSTEELRALHGIEAQADTAEARMEVDFISGHTDSPSPGSDGIGISVAEEAGGALLNHTKLGISSGSSTFDEEQDSGIRSFVFGSFKEERKNPPAMSSVAEKKVEGSMQPREASRSLKKKANRNESTRKRRR